MIVRTYYWGSAIGAICMLAVAGIAGAESGEWKLPDKIDISATSMQVSSNHGHVLFLELGKSSRRTSEILRSVFPSAYWSLDTQSGELTNLLDLLETEEDEGKLMVRPRGFSADGKHVLLMAVRIKQKQARRAKQRGLSAYIVTLQSGAVQKIGERIVSAAWVGNKAALSGLEGTGTRLKIGRIKLVDPADASTTELNVGGLIVCGAEPHPRTDLRIEMANPVPKEGGDAVDDLRRVFDAFKPLIPYYQEWPGNPEMDDWQTWLAKNQE